MEKQKTKPKENWLNKTSITFLSMGLIIGFFAITFLFLPVNAQQSISFSTKTLEEIQRSHEKAAESGQTDLEIKQTTNKGLALNEDECLQAILTFKAIYLDVPAEGFDGEKTILHDEAEAARQCPRSYKTPNFDTLFSDFQKSRE